LKTGTKPYSWP